MLATRNPSSFNRSLDESPRAVETTKVNDICRCALDIGGTLAKVVFVLKYENEEIFGDRNLDLKTGDTRLSCWWPPSRSVQRDQYRGRHFLQTDIKQFNAVVEKCYPTVQTISNDFELYINEENPLEKASGQSLSDDSEQLTGCSLVLRFHFVHTKDIETLMNSLKENDAISAGSILPVTGGGAFKFHEILESRLGVKILKLDEMMSAMTGLSFLSCQSNEVYFHDLNQKQRIPKKLADPIEPFLLINIGSGVSILKAESPSNFVRITGTCIGGGTVMGLARLLIGVASFQEVVLLAERGTNCLDLNVADLFGDTAGSRWFPGDTLASSFGRLYVGMDDKTLSLQDIRKEDIARSLINMISYNLGYLAYLIGIIHNIRRIFFAGKYINNHIVTMEAITHAVNFYIQHYYSRHHLDQSTFRHQEPQHQPRQSHQLSTPLQTLSNGSDDDWPEAANDPTSDKQLSLRNSNDRARSAPPDRTPAKIQWFRDSTTPSAVAERRNGCSKSFLTPTYKKSTTKTMEWKTGENDHKNHKEQKRQNGEKKQFEVLSLKHDGYLGALGALLLAAENMKTKASPPEEQN